MNEELTCFTVETTFGLVTVTASSNGLLSLTLPRQSTFKAPEPPRELTGLANRLQAYFDGRQVFFEDIRLDLSAATPFQKGVWEATRLIPYGETRSYRWVAERVGQPGAVRAVGQALGKNPLPVIIPCHRVIASHGGLGGYSGGLEMKLHLLKLELKPSITKPQRNQ